MLMYGVRGLKGIFPYEKRVFRCVSDNSILHQTRKAKNLQALLTPLGLRCSVSSATDFAATLRYRLALREELNECNGLSRFKWFRFLNNPV